ERFESQLKKEWLLSHSTWRDEKSVVRWRTEAKHHATQVKGRFEIFDDYHLRVGEIVSDTSPPAGIPVAQHRLDESEISAAKFASLTEMTLAAQNPFGADPTQVLEHLGIDRSQSGLLEHDVYKSVSAIYPDDRPYQEGKLALLLTWASSAAAAAWTPKTFDGVRALRHRVVRVVRDYGMFDRREAPQYYRDIEGGKATLHPAPIH
ncbi:MAG: antibiotic biosynthesis monooxygenase, partial [Alphaproteobacteria bacterium]|nr:antibiotic biosynthesis monooxygenase [Alphaproteobacteria bacterium]